MVVEGEKEEGEGSSTEEGRRRLGRGAKGCVRSLSRLKPTPLGPARQLHGSAKEAMRYFVMRCPVYLC